MMKLKMLSSPKAKHHCLAGNLPAKRREVKIIRIINSSPSSLTVLADGINAKGDCTDMVCNIEALSSIDLPVRTLLLYWGPKVRCGTTYAMHPTESLLRLRITRGGQGTASAGALRLTFSASQSNFDLKLGDPGRPLQQDDLRKLYEKKEKNLFGQTLIEVVHLSKELVLHAINNKEQLSKSATLIQSNWRGAKARLDKQICDGGCGKLISRGTRGDWKDIPEPSLQDQGRCCASCIRSQLDVIFNLQNHDAHSAATSTAPAYCRLYSDGTCFAFFQNLVERFGSSLHRKARLDRHSQCRLAAIKIQAVFRSFCVRRVKECCVCAEKVLQFKFLKPHGAESECTWCISCFKTYADMKFGEGALFIKCLSCPKLLDPHFLERNATQAKLEQARQTAIVAHQARAAELATFAKNGDLGDGHIRQCPSCSVAFHKYEGCSHVQCAVCGSDFNFHEAVDLNGGHKNQVNFQVNFFQSNTMPILRRRRYRFMPSCIPI